MTVPSKAFAESFWITSWQLTGVTSSDCFRRIRDPQEAFPFDSAPRYLLRDGDGIYGEKVQRHIKSLSIDEVVTAPASPWQARMSND